MATDRLSSDAPYGFDASVWEFFWPLLTGARLVMARPEGHRDPRYLVETVRERGVTVLQTVPSLLDAVRWRSRTAADCRSLRQLLRGGEALCGRAAWAGCWIALAWGRSYNVYGPTEATMDASLWPARVDAGRRVPIGRPVAQRPALRAGRVRGDRVAGGRAGRAVHRRRGAGARLPGPAGADGGALRARSVRGGAGSAAVPDGRPGALAAGRRPRVPGPGRPAGEDARLPHRAGRDRGGAAGARRACERRWSLARTDERGTGGWWPTWWPGRKRRARLAEAAGVPARAAAGVHGAGGVRGAARRCR